ncbi:hypothetical protein ACLD9W_02050, partial [Neisseria sp. WLZKY-1]|uniref:hypothetical protein n=1 Tax=Neisseria sp. WLZKY-1 TaxID=3390377 RepID=UPI003979889A
SDGLFRRPFQTAFSDGLFRRPFQTAFSDGLFRRPFQTAFSDGLFRRPFLCGLGGFIPLLPALSACRTVPALGFGG